MVKNTTQKMRITIQAYDHKLLESAIEKIVTITRDSWAIVVGPIPLPTKIEKLTLNRSTFVNKTSREQFEIRRHKRIIDIDEPTPKTFELLKWVSIPSKVWIEIKTI